MLNKFLKFIDLKGGIWLGLFTAVILGGVVRNLFFNGPDIAEGVRWIFGTTLGAYASTKISAKMTNGKNGHPVTEE